MFFLNTHLKGTSVHLCIGIPAKNSHCCQKLAKQNGRWTGAQFAKPRARQYVLGRVMAATANHNQATGLQEAAHGVHGGTCHPTKPKTHLLNIVCKYTRQSARLAAHRIKCCSHRLHACLLQYNRKVHAISKHTCCSVLKLASMGEP